MKNMNKYDMTDEEIYKASVKYLDLTMDDIKNSLIDDMISKYSDFIKMLLMTIGEYKLNLNEYTFAYIYNETTILVNMVEYSTSDKTVYVHYHERDAVDDCKMTLKDFASSVKFRVLNSVMENIEFFVNSILSVISDNYSSEIVSAFKNKWTTI